MQPFYIFGIRSVLIGFFFYGIYFFFLKNKAPFNFIRFYLILALISMSLFPILPFLGIPFPKIDFFAHLPIKDSINGIWINTVTVGSKSQTSHFDVSILLYSYLSIAGIQILRILWSFISIVLLWLKSNKTAQDGLNIAITPKQVAVFSIFNWIFIDQKTLSLRDAGLILAHEKLHIQQNHTFDLIFGELLRVVLWFNPFIHLIIKEIKANHEFLADVSIIETPGKLKNYQNLLVQLSTSIDFNILTHNFSYSLIKRRINMIKKPKRSTQRFQLYSLTMLALAGVLFACSSNPQDKVTATSQMEKNQLHQLDVNAFAPPVFTKVEKMPEFPGGTDALMKYLATHINYPAQAKKDGIQGRVFASFIINTDGSISGVRIVKSISPSLDAEVIKIIKSMPHWTPGEQKGQKVRVEYTLPVKFSLK